MWADSMRAVLVLCAWTFLITSAMEGATQRVTVFPAGQACWRRSGRHRIITQVVPIKPRVHSQAPHREQHSFALGEDHREIWEKGTWGAKCDVWVYNIGIDISDQESWTSIYAKQREATWLPYWFSFCFWCKNKWLPVNEM